MPQYALMVHGAPAGPAEQDQHEREQVHAWTTRIGGEVLEQVPLAPSSTAVVVRDGQVSAEAEAGLGSTLDRLYVIEAPDLDAALALAKQGWADCEGVEVRPVMQEGMED